MYKTYPEAAAAAAAAGLTPADPLKQPLELARRTQNAYLEALASAPAQVARVTDLEVPGPHGAIRIRLTFPVGGPDLPLVLYVRGGGWWSGSLDASMALVNQLANASGSVVCSVDYRCAPEYKYPTQLEEVMAVLEWIATADGQWGFDPAKLVFFGDSAGASLVLAAAMRLRDDAKPLPLGIVQFYTNALGPPPNGKPISNWVWENYLPDVQAGKEAGAAPLNGDFTGLPPMWLGVGDLDHILKDTLELAARCEAAGIAHVLRRWPDMPHGFLQFVSSLEPAAEAVEEAARFIRTLVH